MNPLQGASSVSAISILDHLTPLQRDIITLVAIPQFENWPDRWYANSERLRALASGLVRRGLIREIVDAPYTYETTEVGTKVGFLALQSDNEMAESEPLPYFSITEESQ
jgi:hypothetical protein